MHDNLRNAILEMYAIIDNARQIQEKTGHFDQGKRMGITSGKHFESIENIIVNAFAIRMD